MSKVTRKFQTPLWERPVGCRRISSAWRRSRPSQRGPDPPPTGFDARSPGLWPEYLILAALQEDIAAAARPFIELMNLRDILSFAQIKKYFLQWKQIDLALELQHTTLQKTAWSSIPFTPLTLSWLYCS